MSKPQDPIRDQLIIPVSVLIMLSWAAALGYALLRGQYTPLTIVTPVMLLLAGYVFGTSIVKRSANGD